MKAVITALQAERKAAVAQLAKIDRLIAQLNPTKPAAKKPGKPMSQATKDKIKAALVARQAVAAAPAPKATPKAKLLRKHTGTVSPDNAAECSRKEQDCWCGKTSAPAAS